MKDIDYKEVYPGIFRITRKQSRGNIRPQVNLYLIPGPDGLIYDAGHGDRNSIKLAAQAMREICHKWEDEHGTCQLNRLLISHGHADHFSGATGLRRELGVRIIATQHIADIIRDKKSFKAYFRGHRPSRLYHSTSFFYKRLLDVQYKLGRLLFVLFFKIRFMPNPDEIIPETSTISINNETWDIFPSPGHCPAHITLYNRSKGILFSGDNVLRTVAPWLGPPKSCLSDYMQSLKEFLDLPQLEVILPGHGSPIDNPRERIQELIDWRRLRTNQVLEIVSKEKEKGIRFGQLMKDLYPGSTSRKRYIASGWVQLSLDYLEDRGFVERVQKGTEIYFKTDNSGAVTVMF